MTEEKGEKKMERRKKKRKGISKNYKEKKQM